MAPSFLFLNESHSLHSQLYLALTIAISSLIFIAQLLKMQQLFFYFEEVAIFT